MICQPIAVSYGVGVDSTGVLALFGHLGIRPDLIMTADTGGEKPETYRYANEVMDPWLAMMGFPPITWVRYQPKRATYHTLEAKCLSNETLPALAYGGKSCSIVFKGKPQDKFVKQWQPAIEAWDAGIPVMRVIGYDNGPADRKRRAHADAYLASEAGKDQNRRYRNAYPLQDWCYPLQDHGMDRLDCIRMIERMGLPVPMKSACFYCPASKKPEIAWLKENHPDLHARAIAIETTARDGKSPFRGSTKGLGRNFAWEGCL